MVNDIIKGMGIMCLFGLLMLLIFSRFYDGPVIVTVDNSNYNYRHILNEMQSINTKIDDVNTTQINNNQGSSYRCNTCKCILSLGKVYI